MTQVSDKNANAKVEQLSTSLKILRIGLEINIVYALNILIYVCWKWLRLILVAASSSPVVLLGRLLLGEGGKQPLEDLLKQKNIIII